MHRANRVILFIGNLAEKNWGEHFVIVDFASANIRTGEFLRAGQRTMEEYAATRIREEQLTFV